MGRPSGKMCHQLAGGSGCCKSFAQATNLAPSVLLQLFMAAVGSIFAEVGVLVFQTFCFTDLSHQALLLAATAIKSTRGPVEPLTKIAALCSRLQAKAGCSIPHMFHPPFPIPPPPSPHLDMPSLPFHSSLPPLCPTLGPSLRSNVSIDVRRSRIAMLISCAPSPCAASSPSPLAQ